MLLIHWTILFKHLLKLEHHLDAPARLNYVSEKEFFSVKFIVNDTLVGMQRFIYKGTIIGIQQNPVHSPRIKLHTSGV